MRYIMITEDGSIYKADGVSIEDEKAADMDILVIIHVETMTEYVDGSWVPLTDWIVG